MYKQYALEWLFGMLGCISTINEKSYKNSTFLYKKVSKKVNFYGESYNVVFLDKKYVFHFQVESLNNTFHLELY